MSDIDDEVAEYAQILNRFNTADPAGMYAVAANWATLSGLLEAASSALTQHQASLMATGWNSPATESFNNYVATLQQKAAVLIEASNNVSTALTDAAAAGTAPAGLLPGDSNVFNNGDPADVQARLQKVLPQARQAQTTLETGYRQAAAAITTANAPVTQAMAATAPSVGSATPDGTVSGVNGGGLPGPSPTGVTDRPSVHDVTGIPLTSEGSTGQSAPGTGRLGRTSGSGADTSTAGLGGGPTRPDGQNPGGGMSGPPTSGGDSAGTSGASPVVSPFVPVGNPSGESPGDGASGGSRSYSNTTPLDDPGIYGGIPTFNGDNSRSGFGKIGGALGDGASGSAYGDGVTGIPLSEAPGGDFSPATGGAGHGWPGTGPVSRAATPDAEGFNPMPGMRGGGYGGMGIGERAPSAYASRYRVPRPSVGGPVEDPGIEGLPLGSNGSRLDASPVEEAGPPKGFRGPAADDGAVADTVRGGFPAGSGGVGTAGEERQRERSRYRLTEPPETWASTAEVVPPVIE